MQLIRSDQEIRIMFWPSEPQDPPLQSPSPSSTNHIKEYPLEELCFILPQEFQRPLGSMPRCIEGFWLVVAQNLTKTLHAESSFNYSSQETSTHKHQFIHYVSAILKKKWQRSLTGERWNRKSGEDLAVCFAFNVFIFYIHVRQEKQLAFP